MAQAVLDANGGELPKGDGLPSLREWNQQSALLATLIDEVRQTNVLMLAINRREGTTAPKLVPTPRPTSAYTKLAGQSRHEKAMKRHDDLVAKLLGDRAKRGNDSDTLIP